MEVAYRSLERFAGQLKLVKDETVDLIEGIRSAIELAVRCIEAIDHVPPTEYCSIEALQQELEEYAKGLDIVRGNFQIAVVLHRAASPTGNSKESFNTAESFLRRWLKPSNQTTLDEGCLPDTRSSILREATNWLKDPSAPNILWIVGAPGAGKSTVATTLVREISSSSTYVCGKSFAKRDFVEQRDPTRIWGTLTYDLACLHIGLKGTIMEALDMEGRFGSRQQPEEDQKGRGHSLIVEAVTTQQSLPVVIVIDALDEYFSDLEDNESSRIFLRSVTDCASLSRSFKFIVTSRDFVDVRRTLEEVSHVISLGTGREAPHDAVSDVEKFLFSERAGLPSSWLERKIVRQLAEHAAGSFIWAKMVAGLVKLKPDCHPEDILNGSGDVFATGSTEDVDLLYGRVLTEIFGQLQNKERDTSRAIIAAIVLAKNPLQYDLLELLPSNDDKPHKFTEGVVQSLCSIIAVESDLHVRIPHKSFSDFFLDSGRCLKAMERLGVPAEHLHTYLIRQDDDNANLAVACLRWMNKSLKLNTFGIPTSHSLNINCKLPMHEAAKSGQKSTNHALVYACQFWGTHISDASRNESFRVQAQSLLYTLLNENALFWLEAMSLLKAIPSAELSLQAAKHFLKKSNDNDLAAVADDIMQFVEHFEIPITAAASHIYISALPFSPSNSRIFKIYGHRFPGLLSVTSGRRKAWSEAEVNNPGHDDRVYCIDFFPDGSKLASGSLDKTMRIWDPRTGMAVSSPLLHLSSVLSIAVSPEGNSIACGCSDSAFVARIRNLETGGQRTIAISRIAGLLHEGSGVRSVAFSPDGSRIATGSNDKTVKVWDSISGELCLGPLGKHTDAVNPVAFSPDSALVVSASDDYKIRIWDATTGESHRRPLGEEVTITGHTGGVVCLAFSADGRYLASGSSKGKIQVWDVTQGFTQTSNEYVGNMVLSISFSPNCASLVSGHLDGSICFWNIIDGKLESGRKSIYGHMGDVNSVLFSPDGSFVASASGDSSIKIWTVPPNFAQTRAIPSAKTDKPPNEASTNTLDLRGRPVLTDESYIDENGWLRESRTEGANVLCWIPRENRKGFWFFRNTAVIHKNVTKIDFSNFAHGKEWADCAKPIWNNRLNS